MFGGCCCAREGNCWDAEELVVTPKVSLPPATVQDKAKPPGRIDAECRQASLLSREERERIENGAQHDQRGFYNTAGGLPLVENDDDKGVEAAVLEALDDLEASVLLPASKAAGWDEANIALPLALQRSLSEAAPTAPEGSPPSRHSPNRSMTRPRSDSCPAFFRAEERQASPRGLSRRATACVGLRKSSSREFELEAGSAAGEARRTPAVSDASAEAQTSGEAPDWDADEPQGESWPAFLSRAASYVADVGVHDDPAALFEAFRTTEDIGLAYAAFARLFHLAVAPVEAGGQRKSSSHDVAPPWEDFDGGRRWQFPYQEIRLLLGGNWKAKQLWKVLDQRVGQPEYAHAPCGRGRLRGQRCVVVGAGPCGLRAAIELRLLGAQVTVVEQRVRFSRINQLHIWSWVGEDLKGLGARCMEPPPSNFGANPDLLHITINDLQKFLLKVALLLGAEVLLGVEYAGMHWDASCGWTARLRPARGSLAMGAEGRAGPAAVASFVAEGPLTSPAAPAALAGVGALIGSGGFASGIAQQVGITQLETEGLRRESAIGLICNLARANGKCEGALRSFSMARQFYGQLFRRAFETTGVDLENIVYVKSHVAHYFVMTPTPKSLREAGVVIDPACEPMLSRDNIDLGKLDELVRRVAAFPFKKDQMPVLEAIAKDLGGQMDPEYADSGPRLFDFSKMRRSQEGLKLLQPPSGGDAFGEEDSLLAALVGDSLVEPFWPEGLGIIRGFFGVLDACSAIHQWANGASQAEVLHYYDQAYQTLKTLSAATRRSVLHENESRYALAPSSRYR